MFDDVKNVKSFFSVKKYGNLSFKWNGPNVVENRKKFFQEHGLNLSNLVIAEQIHSGLIQEVGLADMGRGSVSKDDWIEKVDGLVTREKGVILGVEIADCLPIFAVDPTAEIVGVAHAGWRGVVSNISVNLIEKMVKIGAKKEAIRIEIGPHIRKCCFEVKSDILANFEPYLGSVSQREGRTFADLSLIVRKQLTLAGILDKNIYVGTECTCCSDKYYSFRRDKQENDGSMVGVVTIS